MVHCSWTLCEYCQEIKQIQGICKHPNGAKKMVESGDIIVVRGVRDNSMIKCKLYSRKE